MDNTEAEPLCDALCEWLRSVVASVGDALGQQVQVDGYQVSFVDATSIRWETRTRRVPLLSLELPRLRALAESGIHRYEPLTEQEIGAARRVADLLPAGPLRMWTWHSDKETAVQLHLDLLIPLADAVLAETAGRPGTAEAVVGRAAAAAASALVSRRGRAVTRVAVGGLAVPLPVADDWLSIRALTASEIEGLLKAPGDSIGPGRGLAPPDLGPVERVLLEARADVDVGAPGPPLVATAKAILALQLIGAQPCGAGWTTTALDPPSTWRSGHANPVPLPPSARATTTLVDAALVKRVRRLADEISDTAVTEPATRRDVALNRFGRGCRAPGTADALLEHTIALEAMLLPPQFQGELRFRLAVLTGWLLGGNTLERRKQAKAALHVYDVRSALVHGAKPPQHRDVVTAAEEASRLARTLLLRFFESGWPTEQELADLPYG